MAGYDKEHVHVKFLEKGREAKIGREACERAPGEPSAVASERLSEVWRRWVEGGLKGLVGWRLEQVY